MTKSENYHFNVSDLVYRMHPFNHMGKYNKCPEMMEAANKALVDFLKQEAGPLDNVKEEWHGGEYRRIMISTVYHRAVVIRYKVMEVRNGDSNRAVDIQVYLKSRGAPLARLKSKLESVVREAFKKTLKKARFKS